MSTCGLRTVSAHQDSSSQLPSGRYQKRKGISKFWRVIDAGEQLG